MKLNDYDGMPSIHAVIKNINKNRRTITEGVLRHEELAQYMKSLKLDMFVCLSEDATNITGKIEYSTKSNQIVGYSPPLSEETGMPKPLTFPATSASVMETIMVDPNSLHSNVVNVVMAQPLALKTPAFCLLVYGGRSKFTKEDVAKRWAYITEKLADVGIKVMGFASDSDTRYNGAMRDLMLDHKTDAFSAFPSCFSFDCATASYLPFQDTVHIGTKLRNRLLNDKINLLFGKQKITKQHLVTLIDTVSRQKHGLFKTHIENNDKMNFLSVQKISDPKVMMALKEHVEGSAATVMFLNLIDKILRAFLDLSLTPSKRINNMWYALTLLRIWRKFTAIDPDQSAQNFITEYTYICIEVNAHSLVTLILNLQENNMEKLFLPHLMSSQPCESFFRDFRSFSTLGSTVTNTSILGMMQRCERMALMNEISRITLTNHTFTTDSKRSREIYYNSNISGYKNTTRLPTRNEIFKEIELAKQAAIKDAAELGIEVEMLDPEQPFDFKCEITRVIRAKQLSPPVIAVPRVNGTRLQHMKAVHLKDYPNVATRANFNEESPYVMVDDVNLDGSGERRICVKKADFVNLYSERCPKLSSDRLLRVKQRVPQKKIIGEYPVDVQNVNRIKLETILENSDEFCR